MKLTVKKTALIAALTISANAFAQANVSQALGTLAGMQLDSQIEQMVSPIDKAQLIKAFESAINGSPMVTDEEMRAILDGEMAKIQAKSEEQANANLEKSNTFIADYAKGDGVKKTEKGVYYKEIKAGTGASPKNAESTVTVHYDGKLMDDTVFDSSRERGEPATFALGQVIPGWREAVQNMKVGDQWEVVIPPELGYGPQPSGPIPANSVLIFDIELVDVKEAE